MKILFISKYPLTHVGGVEKHIGQISKELIKLGHTVKVISKKDIKYPEVKFIGLLYIWFWLFRNRNLILHSDIVHIHDVFIWYLPFRFIFPFKKVYTTFHGWETKYPIPFWNILNKRIANKLSKGTISIGKYINKWYGIKSTKTLYGGKPEKIYVNKSRDIDYLYVGRLEKDTGLPVFLSYLDPLDKKVKVVFIGKGSLKDKCAEYGKVLGITNPDSYYARSKTVISAGYLSYIEAKTYKCKILTFANNPLKKDYWNEVKKIKSFPTWKGVADEYISLYNNI